MPGPARPAAQRDAAGRLLPGDGTKALARAGGKAKAEAAQLGRLLGLAEVDEAHPLAPYRRLAREFRDEHMTRMAATVGGGEVGPGPASVIASAALQLAASRWLSDHAENAKDHLDAQRLADASRQNLLAAHELCAREAEAIRRAGKRTGVAAFRASLGDES